ncbi:hypothetical protein GGR57DRAFT_494733 [Xylariaceae sp. FL1272]|nr:hypothetical protein GGR57DRAFT_494733 [Xylariaceae sp. FL1272]
MEAARIECEARTKTPKIRALPRNRATVQTLHSLADTIPDQYGLSVVRGSMKTIFELLRQRIDNREKILQTFEDIPSMFLKACEAFSIHPGDAILRNHVESLCATIRSEASKLTALLNPEKKSFFPLQMIKRHPVQVSSCIDTCLNHINRAAQNVSDRASFLKAEMAVENLRATQNIDARVNETHVKVTGLYAGLQQIHDRQIEGQRWHRADRESRDHDLKQFSHVIDQKLDCMADSFRKAVQCLHQDISWRLEQMPLPFYNFQHGRKCQVQRNGHYFFLFTKETYVATNVLQQAPSAQSLALPHSQPLLVANHDHARHFIYITSINDDLEDVARKRHQFNTQAMARASWLLVVERFQAWSQFSESQSDLLLVDAYLGDYTIGKVSPLSLITMALQTLVDQQPHLVIIYFFCGLHLRDESIPMGPKGMLSSLIAQLTFRLQLLDPATMHYIEDIYAGIDMNGVADIPQLCALFAALLNLFPPNMTIYCILNDISEFETSLHGWENELCAIFDYFRQLMHNPAVNVTLKLLMTVAHKSITICRRVHPSEHVTLEAGNARSDDAVF